MEMSDTILSNEELAQLAQLLLEEESVVTQLREAENILTELNEEKDADDEIPADSDLIQLYTGEYVEQNGGDYVLLNSKFYNSNIYAHNDEVAYDDYNEGYILDLDAIYTEDYGTVHESTGNVTIVDEVNNRSFYVNIANISDFHLYEFDKENNWYKKESFNLENLPYYKDLVESLDLFYPEMWEFKKTKDFKIRNLSFTHAFLLVIKFPLIKITNSSGHSHIIHDIFVALPFNKISSTGRLMGLKETFTMIEYTSNYIHSHLPSGNNTYFNSFCTGSGEINSIMGRLAKEFSAIEFKALLATLKPYLEWESLEGRPYVEMANVSGKAYINTGNSINFDQRKILSYIKDNSDDIQITLSHDKFAVNDLILEEVLTKCKDTPKVYYDPAENKHFNTREFTNLVILENPPYFEFKGKPVKRNVLIEEKKEEKNNLIIKVHPYVKKVFEIFLNKRITEYYYSKN